MTFLPNPLVHPVVNHIDRNKSNNLITNLEWCTFKENSQHWMRLDAQVAAVADTPIDPADIPF